MAEAKTNTDPTEKTVTLRGTPYHLRELTIAEYDDCVVKATDTKQNALGEDIEVTDRGRLLRLMVLKSAGLTLADLSTLKMPVVLKLNQLVNDMHYVDELTDEEKAEEKKTKKAVEPDGDSSGNAR